MSPEFGARSKQREPASNLTRKHHYVSFRTPLLLLITQQLGARARSFRGRPRHD